MKKPTHTGTTALLFRLWHHLSRRRHYQFLCVMALAIFSAFAEMLSLGAVLPFIGILIAPHKLFDHAGLAHFVQHWGITSPEQLIAPLTIIFIITILISNTLRIFHTWVMTRVTYAIGADISGNVYRRTLYQPYQVHIARNSSTLISSLGKIEITTQIIFQIFTLITSIVLFIAITTALLFIDAFIAITAAIGFSLIYGFITWASRKQLRQNSQQISHEQNQVVKMVQEGLGGIRDILLDGTQPVYCNSYEKADRLLQHARGNNTFIGSSPRFIVEGLGMILIAALAFIISHNQGGISTGLPGLAALALGAQRLLPALQQGYSAWTDILGCHASITEVLDFLDQTVAAHMYETPIATLSFQQSIECDTICFRYTPNSAWVLDNVSFKIPKGSRIGFVGSTGSGKTTLLDIIMGLLTPTTGTLRVDGIAITANAVKAWQQNIAHVPQSIYLADTTIAENIAFGVPFAAIDMARVRKAAQQAHIAEYIESQTNGYQATIGERGVQLSGGQRQRIGIARAFYKQANLLIFDEATSALDNTTEKSVMASIENLDYGCTILVIAHRLTTIQSCDTIVELDHGRLVAQGSYQELLEKSASFRKMASINH